MSRPLPLALVQAAARSRDQMAGFGHDLERLSRQYGSTRLFVFPELHLCAPEYETSDGIRSLARSEPAAEPLDGPRGRMLAEISGDLKIWLAAGSVYELAPDGRIYNTAVVYSPDGVLAASYRKVFPWRPYEKSAAGSRFVVFDMAGYGRVGLSICYDTWFPESTRHLAWMGAELVINVVRTGTIDRAQELVIDRANAIVNQVAIASVNAAAPHGLGQSLICDAEGRVRVAAADSAEQVLTDVIDLDDVAKVRRFGTAGLNRPWDQFRPDDDPLELPMYGGRIDPSTWSASATSHPQGSTGTGGPDIEGENLESR